MRWDYQNTIEPSNSCPPPPSPGDKGKRYPYKKICHGAQCKIQFFFFYGVFRYQKLHDVWNLHLDHVI